MRNILPAMALILAAACGNPPNDASGPEPKAESAARPAPEADRHFRFVDSIGVEVGDSNYVFGTVSSARITADGSILVVDMQRAAVLFYTPEGEFVRQVGRRGSGPGELNMPSDAAFLEDGRLVVANSGARSLSFFDSEFEHLYDLTDFFPAPPMSLVPVAGNMFVGLKPDWQQNEDGMFMGFTVACWNDSGGVEATYHSSMSPFDPADVSAMMHDMVLFSASRSGRVFTATYSSEEYAVTAWSPEGEELFTIDREMERVPKTADEMERETEIARARMVQNGMPPEMARWEPDPYRSMVGSIQVDAQDRVWVGRGTIHTPFYDVYDLDGERLFTAALEPDAGYDEYMRLDAGEEVFIGFNPDPEEYPRIYLMELEETRR